ncbi:hypothetical protein AVEN_218884-1 [Araneus ventricosus]|uniref:LIM zinc-binding domain-containing protein n=1 Tax=Araneus ventricosus TaxID=182803 RepID=A0A4Y2L4U2_ARAVE|nr:hypothetical protein AVEN_218884-1 [Araneus ventricosus]
MTESSCNEEAEGRSSSTLSPAYDLTPPEVMYYHWWRAFFIEDTKTVMFDSKETLSRICPTCGKTVYNAEKVMFMKRLWHRSCLRCAKCNRVLEAVKAYVDEGKPYCPMPCYNNLFRTKGYIRPTYS